MTQSTTWRSMITDELTSNGETWADVVSCTLPPAELDAGIRFGDDAPPFAAWTANYVYVDDGYDSRSWVRSVRRNP